MQKQDGLLITYSAFLKQHGKKKWTNIMDEKKITQKQNKTFFIIVKWAHPGPTKSVFYTGWAG